MPFSPSDHAPQPAPPRPARQTRPRRESQQRFPQSLPERKPSSSRPEKICHRTIPKCLVARAKSRDPAFASVVPSAVEGLVLLYVLKTKAHTSEPSSLQHRSRLIYCSVGSCYARPCLRSLFQRPRSAVWPQSSSGAPPTSPEDTPRGAPTPSPSPPFLTSAPSRSCSPSLSSRAENFLQWQVSRGRSLQARPVDFPLPSFIAPSPRDKWA